MGIPTRSRALTIAGLMTFLPPFADGIEARLQNGHSQQEHAEFFNGIMAEIQSLHGQRDSGSPGDYTFILNKIIDDYGLSIRVSDVVGSENFIAAHGSDYIVFYCTIPRSDRTTIYSIWVNTKDVRYGG